MRVRSKLARLGLSLAALLLLLLLLSGCHEPVPPAPSLGTVVEGPPAGREERPGPSDQANQPVPEPAERPPGETAAAADAGSTPRTETEPPLYQEVWSVPLASEVAIEQLYIAPGGKAIAYREAGRATVLQRDGKRRQLPIPSGHLAVPMPDLQVWLTKQPDKEGDLQARALDGQPRWQVAAPAGELQISPDGGLVVISGATKERGRTVILRADGQRIWETDQFGGTLSFTDAGEILVWDAPQKRWQLITPQGAMLHAGRLLESPGGALLVSRGGRQLIDTANGVLELLSTEQDPAKMAAPGIIQGPGPFFAGGHDLYLFTKVMGLHTKLQALRGDGILLWSMPAGASKGLISADDRLVFLIDSSGLQVLDGGSGALRWRLPQVIDLVPTADDRFLLLRFADRLAILEALGPSGRSHER